MKKLTIGYAPTKGIAPKPQEYSEIGMVYAFNAKDFEKSTPLSNKNAYTKVRALPKGATNNPTFKENLKTFGKRIAKFLNII